MPRLPSSSGDSAGTPMRSTTARSTRKPGKGWPRWDTSVRSPTPPSRRGRSSANPKEKIVVFNELSRAREMGMGGTSRRGHRIIEEDHRRRSRNHRRLLLDRQHLFQASKIQGGHRLFRAGPWTRKPDDSFAVINVAAAYEGHGEIGGRGEVRSRLSQERLLRLTALFSSGQLKFLQKKYDQAIKYYDKCMSLNSESSASHNALAGIYIVKDDLAQARKHPAGPGHQPQIEQRVIQPRPDPGKARQDPGSGGSVSQRAQSRPTTSRRSITFPASIRVLGREMKSSDTWRWPKRSTPLSL